MRIPSLNTLILVGACVGFALGLYLHRLGSDSPQAQTVLAAVDLIGTLFVELLKMILIPLVFTSISVGISNLGPHDQAQRAWTWTLVYFLSTTILAALVGLTLMNGFKPGQGLDPAVFRVSPGTTDTQRLTPAGFLVQVLHGLFRNPIAAMAEGNVLATVAFALFFGLALARLQERSKHLQQSLREFLEAILVIVAWIMHLAPLGVCALLAKLTATQDLDLLFGIAAFVAVVLGGLLLHGMVTLPTLLYAITGTHPSRFFHGTSQALLTAFATCSSSATLPVTMRSVRKHLGVDARIASFIPPLGATMNMDGTALYEASAALFVANLVGIELNVVQQGVVCLMAIAASIGAPGIPSAGMVTLVMVLQTVGLPAEAVGILLPIDRLLDAFRTLVNVEGDMVGCLIVERLVAPGKNRLERPSTTRSGTTA
jgi:Na+/H+-dicarboxylate symporter